MRDITKALEQIEKFSSPEGRAAVNQATIVDRELRQQALAERRLKTQEGITPPKVIHPTKDFLQELQDGKYGRLD